VQQKSDLSPDGAERAFRRGGAAGERLPGGDVTVDEMSDASFPASDPPARWTWEVPMTTADGHDSGDSGRKDVGVSTTQRNGS
jgi:hypothetical protein